MSVQVIVAAMHQQDHSLLEKMNIQTDAIIGNQCNRNEVENFSWNGHHISYLNFAERGVGLNRNNALLRTDGDIITFADEDTTFMNGYEDIITKAFAEIPQADAIIFNTKTVGGNRHGRINKKAKRIRFFNALIYDTSRISVRSCAIKRENILFHTCFGGGTKYSCGEDTLFIVDMLKAGLKIYTHPAYVLTSDFSTSTWFDGYNEKYLHDKGALFYAVSKRWSSLLCLQNLVRHPFIYKDSGLSFMEAFKLMRTGKEHFKTLKVYDETSNT